MLDKTQASTLLIVEKDIKRLNGDVQSIMDDIKDVKLHLEELKDEMSTDGIEKERRREVRREISELKAKWDKLDSEKNRLKSQRYIRLSDRTDLLRMARMVNAVLKIWALAR